MIKYSLYITEKQEQKLKDLSNDDKTSVSEHIRMAINNYLREIERSRVSTSPSTKKD